MDVRRIFGTNDSEDRVPELAIGAAVVVTDHLHRLDIANGQTGTVLGPKRNKNGELTGVIVQLDAIGDTASRKVTIPYATGKPIMCTCGCVSAAKLPLELHYAGTTHKFQGRSVPNQLYVDLNGAFEPGMAYVAISRVTNPANLVLSHPMSVQDLRVLNFGVFSSNPLIPASHRGALDTPTSPVRLRTGDAHPSNYPPRVTTPDHNLQA